jgi:hypothetical protein
MSKPPYSSTGIRIATVLALISASVVGVGFSAWPWAIPTAVVVGLMGVKLLGAKSIPWLQVVLASGSIVLVHVLVEELVMHTGFVPLIKLGELLFPIVCVLGFGRHWVKRGYIPAEANHW